MFIDWRQYRSCYSVRERVRVRGRRRGRGRRREGERKRERGRVRRRGERNIMYMFIVLLLFCSLKKLKVLHLAYNSITELPPE